MEWNMVWDGKGKGGSRRLTHVHNLPDAWIPEEVRLPMYELYVRHALTYASTSLDALYVSSVYKTVAA